MRAMRKSRAFPARRTWKIQRCITWKIALGGISVMCIGHMTSSVACLVIVKGSGAGMNGSMYML
jgi:hypothetical protein